MVNILNDPPEMVYRSTVSYNNDNVNLIGMSIMKDWDIHIGKDRDNKTVFLGCPRKYINDEYILELERTFGIGSIINSTIVRKEGINNEW